MPTDTRALTRAARDRARHTGEPYEVARAAVLAERDHTDAPEFAAAQVTADGDRLTLTLTPADDAGDAFTGWRRVLPLTSSPRLVDEDVADRILAEARWARRENWPDTTLTVGSTVRLWRQESVRAARAVREATFSGAQPDQPCRCSTYRLTGHPCDHGKPCPRHQEEGQERCDGRVVHADRYPGSIFTIHTWEDVFACATCDIAYVSDATIAELPFGEQTSVPYGDGQTTTSTRFYDGTRHPASADAFWDEVCQECGASAGYRCSCGDNRCSECGADNAYPCSCG